VQRSDDWRKTTAEVRPGLPVGSRTAINHTVMACPRVYARARASVHVNLNRESGSPFAVLAVLFLLARSPAESNARKYIYIYTYPPYAHSVFIPARYPANWKPTLPPLLLSKTPPSLAKLISFAERKFDGARAASPPGIGPREGDEGRVGGRRRRRRRRQVISRDCAGVRRARRGSQSGTSLCRPAPRAPPRASFKAHGAGRPGGGRREKDAARVLLILMRSLLAGDGVTWRDPAAFQRARGGRRAEGTNGIHVKQGAVTALVARFP